MSSSEPPAQAAPDQDLPQLLLSALRHFDDAVLVTRAAPLDEPGPAIIYANAAFTTMTGYGESEVLGRSCRFLQGPGTTREARAAMRQGLQAQVPVRVETVNYRKDGSAFWVEVLITPLRDEQGRLTHFVSVQRDTTARKEAELRLERMVLRQELTGLLNRSGFEAELQRALSLEPWHPVAVVLLDVEGLRHVNHAAGREGGDALLVEVARRLQALCQGDVVGQLGGGEFAVLVRRASVPSLVALCERLRRVLSAPVLVGGVDLVPELSTGVALDRGSGAAALLRDAEVARRAAADEGRGRYVLYEAEMGRAVQRRVELDQGLRAALASGRGLHLQHQPVVDLQDGTVRHAEALLRWDGPDGPVSPAELIPVAEATGAVLPLGRWVTERACREAAAWQPLLPGVGVAVNLSPRQFAAAQVMSDLDRALELLPPSLLTLEITEGALLRDPRAAARQLESVTERGVRVALDDFGTGYSSLAYLKHLPVHEIKVDKVFVAGLPGSRADRAIVQAVVGLAGDLGLTVVAEGVETEEQRDVLGELGCDWAQGWLFARPTAAQDLPGTCAQAEGRALAAPGPTLGTHEH